MSVRGPTMTILILGALFLAGSCSPAQRPQQERDAAVAALTGGIGLAPSPSPSSGSAAPITTAQLRAVASARPMTEEGAAVFRRANAEGYFGLDAILLAENGSERALELLGEMLADRSVPVARRVDAVRFAVYPRRVEASILRMVTRLLAGSIDDEVAIAVIESVFDDRRDQWFDPGSAPKAPPPWERASAEAKGLARELAKQVRARGRISPELLAAVAKREAAIGR